MQVENKLHVTLKWMFQRRKKGAANWIIKGRKAKLQGKVIVSTREKTDKLSLKGHWWDCGEKTEIGEIINVHKNNIAPESVILVSNRSRKILVYLTACLLFSCICCSKGRCFLPLQTDSILSQGCDSCKSIIHYPSAQQRSWQVLLVPLLRHWPCAAQIHAMLALMLPVFPLQPCKCQGEYVCPSVLSAISVMPNWGVLPKTGHRLTHIYWEAVLQACLFAIKKNHTKNPQHIDSDAPFPPREELRPI